MTDEQIKEMLNGIINNGEKWEGRPTNIVLLSNPPQEPKWQPYKLGEGIHEDWEYRKVETWCVTNDNKIHKDKLFTDIVFEGTKEECEKWIEEHTKKTWLEEYLKNYFIEHTEYSLSRRGDLLGGIRIGVTEVCKKILEEVRTHEGIEQMTKFYIGEIIKKLGVEV